MLRSYVILGTTYAFKIFTLGHIYCKISNLKFRGVITFIRLVYQLKPRIKKNDFLPIWFVQWSWWTSQIYISTKMSYKENHENKLFDQQ